MTVHDRTRLTDQSRTVQNKYPPAKPEVFHFRAVSPNTTSSAQVALMTTWQSCDCYLPPVNGPFLCLTFFSYAFAPLFLFLISIFPFTFLSLLFLLFLPFFLSPFLLLVFCSSAKPLLNPRTIRGFSYTKRTRRIRGGYVFYTNSVRCSLLSMPCIKL